MPNLSDENPASAFCCFSLIPAKRMRPFFSLSAPNLHILSLKLCTLNISPLRCARRYLNLGKLNTLIPISRQIWIQTQELFNFLIWEREWAKVREAETTLNCETTLGSLPQLSHLPFRLAIILEQFLFGRFYKSIESGPIIIRAAFLCMLMWN